MVSTTAARSTLGHAITVVLMGTSSAKHDGDGGYNLDLVTLGCIATISSMVALAASMVVHEPSR
jgi:hypothetical protein